MINNFLILCLLSTVALLCCAQSNGESCQTPNNRTGNCVSIRSCDVLLRVATKIILFPEDKIFLEQSRCSSNALDVCCPVAEGTSTTLTSYFTSPTPSPTYTTYTRRTTLRFTQAPTIRISAKKCIEYSDYAYNKSYTINIFGPPKVTKTSNCRFLGFTCDWGLSGDEAKQREFPHMALIGFTYNNEILWLCGGTLISEQFVLSAAHCAQSHATPAEYVRLGERDLSRSNDANHVDFNIIERIVHSNVDERTYNDIILFKLDRQVEFNHAIRPACLPQQAIVPRELSASGWGLRGKRRSNVLLKVHLTTFSQNEWLNSSVGQNYARFRDDTIMFAGHLTERKDTCQGDLGGPLQVLHDTHYCTYVVYGVTSTGECDLIGVPAIYTAVYSHLDWIERTVWPNE